MASSLMHDALLATQYQSLQWLGGSDFADTWFDFHTCPHGHLIRVIIRLWEEAALHSQIGPLKPTVNIY